MIKELKDCWNETHSAWSNFFTEAEEDIRMRMGEQWDSQRQAEVEGEDRAVLSINLMQKPYNLVCGQQRQNRTDLKVYPVEKGDYVSADIYTQAIKWVKENSYQDIELSQAFGDTVDMGLGWMETGISYNRDFFTGDIFVKRISPFQIMPDPYISRIDLEDCGYILRHLYMKKTDAKQIYPAFADDIEKASGEETEFNFVRPNQNFQNIGRMVNIVEKWYKEYEKKIVVVDVVNRTTLIWEDTEKKLNNILDARPEFSDKIKVLKIEVPVIKLYSVCDGVVELYNDIEPDKRPFFPFIPIFGYFSPSFNDWGLKLQGLNRQLKDLQREKNYRRSKLTDAVMSLPYGGWIVDKGAVDDPDVLKKAAGSTSVIDKNPGKEIERIRPPDIPHALIQLEQQLSTDILQVGINPDLQGIMQEAGAPGVTLQIRQKQGLLSLEELFDNLKFSYKTLGRHYIYYINKFADKDPAKIERILGFQLPPVFLKNKDSARYDCIVDEQANSPSAMMANRAELSGLIQHGYAVPPEIMISLSNLSEELKNQWLTKNQNAEKMQAEAQKAAQQQAMRALEIEENVKKEELEIKKRELMIKEKELELEYIKEGINYGFKFNDQLVKQIQTGVNNGVADQN